MFVAVSFDLCRLSLSQKRGKTEFLIGLHLQSLMISGG